MSEKDVLRVFLRQLPDSSEGQSLSVEGQLLLRHIGGNITVRQPSSSSLGLLQNFSFSPDRRTYRFQVRKGLLVNGKSELNADLMSRQVLEIGRRKDSPLGFFQSNPPELKLLSKYRFEIHFPKPCIDLMERLASVVCTSLNLGAGEWRVANHSDDHIDIVLQQQAFRIDRGYIHSEVRVMAAPPENEFDFYMERDPFVFLMPLTSCYFSHETVASELQLKTTEEALGLILLPGIGRDRRSFFAFSRQLRKALRNLFRSTPVGVEISGHILSGKHPLQHEFTGTSSRSHVEQKKFIFSVEPRLLSDALQKSLTEELRVGGFEVDFVKSGEAETDGALLSMPEGEPSDFLYAFYWIRNLNRPLSKNLQKKLDSVFSAAITLDKTAVLRDVFAACLKELGIIPVGRVPLVVRSNRALVASDKQQFFHFGCVGESLEVQQERQLQKDTLAALGASLQSFVHDIRKPFSLMQGYFDMISQQGDPKAITEYSDRYRPKISQTIRKVDRLLVDLLEIGRPTQIEGRFLRFAEVLESALEEVFLFENQDQIDFNYRLNATVGIRGDEARITRVLVNLIANARKAMGGQGEIWFADRVSGDRVVWTVGNSGSYIPEEKRVKLFDQFYTDDQKAGTGLGLAIVKKIVQDHDGYIRCHSSRSAGTEFVLSFPKNDMVEKTSVNTYLPESSKTIQTKVETSYPNPSQKQRPCTILFVDDEPLYRGMLLELATAYAGAGTYLEAANWQKASEILSSKNVDAVVLDLDFFGEIKGPQILEKIKRNFKGIRVYLHSSLVEMIVLSSFQEDIAGAFAKPLRKVDFFKIIQDSSVQSQTRDIIVIDDDPFFVEMLIENLPGYNRHLIDHPNQLQALFKSLESRSIVPAVILTDLYFGKEPLGYSVPETCRNLPVVLMTDLLNPMADEYGFVSSCSKSFTEIQKSLEEAF